MECICESCGTTFERRAAEVRRSRAKGRRLFCSRSCAGRESPAAKNPDQSYLRQGGRTKDDFSPFRPHLARVRQRDKEYTVTLQDLKDCWDAQGGRCRFTGWELKLVNPKHTWEGKLTPPNAASLDRIDSSVGYIRSNIQWVSVQANYAKSYWLDGHVLEFAQAVVAHHSRMNWGVFPPILT